MVCSRVNFNFTYVASVVKCILFEIKKSTHRLTNTSKSLVFVKLSQIQSELEKSYWTYLSSYTNFTHSIFPVCIQLTCKRSSTREQDACSLSSKILLSTKIEIFHKYVHYVHPTVSNLAKSSHPLQHRRFA
jgi:hypothetical protein